MLILRKFLRVQAQFQLWHMLSEWEIISIKTICQCEELRSLYNENLFSNLKKDVTDVIDDNDDVILTVCLSSFRFRSSRERWIVMRKQRICEKQRTIKLRRKQKEKKNKQKKNMKKKAWFFWFNNKNFFKSIAHLEIFDEKCQICRHKIIKHWQWK